MSAIWGIISTGDETIKTEIDNTMRDAMGKYKIDRIESIVDGDVYIACGHQHITPEAEREQLPYYDDSHGIYFTADCMIDNRMELCEQLGVSDTSVPDGSLCYLAYLKWGEKFVEHLLGIFSIAVYDKSNKKLLLYTDHMGSRCINYMRYEDKIMFSTSYDLFINALPEGQLKLSEKWIVGCESEPSACMIIFPGLTPYEGLHQLQAGTYVKYEDGKINEISYWNPTGIKERKGLSDSEYKKLFVDTFTECVSDILRPGVKVAATLSGGLDSSSVVSVAAPILEKRGELIHTYTSVPDYDEELGLSDYFVPDESGAVKKTAEYFPNMQCHFVDCRDESALTRIERLVNDYGFPLKSSINLMWLDEVAKQAREEGCTVILSGQHGNSTISYGDIFSLAYQHVRSFHPLKAKKAVGEFLYINQLHKKNFVNMLKNEMKEKTYIALGLDLSPDGKETYVKQELHKKYHIKRRRMRNARKSGSGLMNTKAQQKRLPFQRDELQQLGLYNTMDSLLNGIVERDPTRDKRIIELCISLPTTCYVSSRFERNLVRGYLEGIVPEHIRTDIRHRGMQGADYVTRINRTWASHREMVCTALKNEKLKLYLDERKLQEMLERCENTEHFEKEDGKFIVYMLYTVALGIFLQQ